MSTPGPRKFLPSNNQLKTPKPVWRIPGPTTHAFRSSSSLKQPPSTQFVDTPRFATGNDSIDEIDVSFENRGSSPTEVKVQRTARTFYPGYDDLVDEDEEADTDLNHSKVRFVKHEEIYSHGPDGHETTRKSSRVGEEIEEDDFPQPTSKRLKTSTQSTKHHDAILTSSSDSEDDGQYKTNHDNHDHKLTRPSRDTFDLDSDFDDDIPSSPSHTRASTSTIPRFKAPAAPAPDLPNTKPIFKPPPPSQIGLNTTILPNTFSPSRRRGKRDYIPGGFADTVRNWVLDLGTSISIPSSGQARILRVARIQHDVEGRCAAIQDERGEEHLLVSQGQQSDAASVGVGRVVEITGAGTSWSIDLGRLVDREDAERGRMEGGAGAGGEGAKSDRSVNVSVLWKLK